MPNLTSVGLTSGVPTTGTGTVSTLDAVIAVLPAALAANGGLKVEGVASGVAQPVSIATVPSHAVTNAGTFAVQEADGANVALGAKSDAKSTATDSTSVSAMQVLKQISASVQAPPSQAVTNAGTFAVQSAATLAAETTKVIGTVNVAAAQSIASTQSGTWTVQPGNTANTTAWKVDGSAVTQPVSVASLPSQAVTNAGTFAVQDTVLDAAIVSQGTALGSIKELMVGGSVTTAAPTYTTGQISPLSLDTAGALRVSGASGGAVTQSGTWTVQPGNTANTTAWKVDGSAVTQPVSISSVPSHAVTNAGTFAVQDTVLDAAIVSQGTALGTIKELMVGGSVTTAAPTYTTGQISPLSIDTAGALRVTGAGGGTQYTEDVAAAADPIGNMLVAVRRDTLSTSEVSADGDNIALKATNKGKLHVASEVRLGDTVADTGSGTGGSATQRVIVDSSQLATLGSAVSASSQPVVIASDQAAVPVKGSGTAGTANTGVVTVQGIASMTKLLVTPDSVALPSNQSVNISQINAVTPLMGSGATGTGSLRTTLATDSPGIITLGQTTKSASVPMTIASDQLGQALQSASMPVTMVPSIGALGSYSMAQSSGIMAAGLSSASPIISFRTGASNLYIVKKIIFSAGDTATAFTAGTVTFNLFAARSFSATDTGGTAATITGNNGKLRTSFATTGIVDFRTSSTATLTAGTRTLDSTPIGSYTASIPATAGIALCPIGTVLFEARPGDMPLVLSTSEGFVVQATVPATGTWTFSVRVYWDEVTAF